MELEDRLRRLVLILRLLLRCGVVGAGGGLCDRDATALRRLDFFLGDNPEEDEYFAEDDVVAAAGDDLFFGTVSC